MTEKITINTITAAVDAIAAIAYDGVDVGHAVIGEGVVDIYWDVDDYNAIHVSICINENGHGAHNAAYKYVCELHKSCGGDSYEVHMGVDGYDVVI